MEARPRESVSSGDRPRTALRRGAGAEFQELAARYLEEYLSKIEIAVHRLSDDDLWWRPAAGCNSAGNLLLHLVGNLSLWVLRHLGGETFERHRAAEFAAEGGATRDELMAALAAVVDRAADVARSLTDERLGEVISAQGYETDARGALFHAVEHMSYHTGQILWLVKARSAATLELYPQHAGE